MKRKTFKKYAGLVVKGKAKQASVDMDSLHLQRAAWLTAEVESGGVYGTVMNYDGTGMTAGIHQAIAVYPRNLEDDKVGNDQGPLWKLLVHMRTAAPESFTLLDLFSRMFHVGWYLDDVGAVRYVDSGKLVHGKNIRQELSGPKGVVPIRGRQRNKATQWVREFHAAFSDDKTFEAQDSFGMTHFVERSEAKLRPCRSQFYRRFTIHDFLYGDYMHITNVVLPWESDTLDLAICMFWSHTVNAPGAALRVLCKDVDAWGLPLRDYRPGRETARRWIKMLGNHQRGRWDDDIPNGRYQRTRRAAMRVWPKELFEGEDAVMPKDLEG